MLQLSVNNKHELLNLQEHSPEVFPGKIIQFGGNDYIIGDLVGQGGVKLVFRLINLTSGLCHYVIQIPIDQELAYGRSIGNSAFSPYAGKPLYQYNRELAQITYHYSGYDPNPTLPLFADFLDIPDFYSENNLYHGIFMVREFFNDGGDENTGGIYLRSDDFDNFLTLFKINLRYHDIRYHDKRSEELGPLCLLYLGKANPNDDNVIEAYIMSQRNKVGAYSDIELEKYIQLVKKMISIEPYFKRHVFLALQVFYHFSMWKDICELFERIKGKFYEIYALEFIMKIIVEAYRKDGRDDCACSYEKYLSSHSAS